MRKLAGIVTSLSLGLAMAAGAPAFAQSAPAAAPTINLAPGTTVYDYATMKMPESVGEQAKNALATIGKALKEAESLIRTVRSVGYMLSEK